ncbi:phosphoribosylamine--glycine ligase [Algiphilus aromaticivorans]|uniref:phosphoribosylamine--glycine ligase n=1 Tax=Algiphilus aromaticivorans TaxID=382454 RepID=UPI0005C14D47|nr:phosphoribosylamine--glycine ligase [Algiphilus aromaticivorans]
MKVLVIGGGGREHALAWKLAQSPRCTEVLVAPGNAGTAREPSCRNVAVSAEDIEGLLALAQDEGVGFTVVGPEAPLAAGVVDAFSTAGLRCFGPQRAAAQLEASKAFSKDFLARHGIPTADYASFTEAEAACAWINARGAPIVVKADGLAAGKGVVVAPDIATAHEAVRDMLALDGARVVVEEFLDGEEASYIVVADGQDFVAFPSAQDHKRIGDGDTGPNTGGMGAYSPAPVVTDAVEQRVRSQVIAATLAGLAADGIAFTGFLYAGLMIDGEGQPKVLEFNVRMGDPETQPLLMRLRSDLLDLLEAAVDHRLGAVTPEWDKQATLGIVLAAEGYPASATKGAAIEGLEAAEENGCKVFQAGTRADDDGNVLVDGGRVLCVCAAGADIAAAQKQAYAGAERIAWPGMQMRRDIGWRAIARG